MPITFPCFLVARHLNSGRLVRWRIETEQDLRKEIAAARGAGRYLLLHVETADGVVSLERALG